MDYSVMLTQILNNQTQILEIMQKFHDFLASIALVLTIFLLYMFIRNVISNK